jgi:hypothetical protein
MLARTASGLCAYVFHLYVHQNGWGRNARAHFAFSGSPEVEHAPIKRHVPRVYLDENIVDVTHGAAKDVSQMK